MFFDRLKILVSLVLFSILLLSPPVHAVDRGIHVTSDDRSGGFGSGVVSIKDSSGQEVGLFTESYALVIGVSRYDNGWPNLPGVSDDIRMVRAALEKHGFTVVVVEDPDRKQLEDSIHQFIYTYGQRKDTRLVFYFAGHGHTLQLAYGGEMGYIVPRDAPNPDDDRVGFLEKAVDMQMFEVYGKRIQSKHALFLFDSCFSGSIFSTSRAVPEHINYKTSLPVRQFITAGSAHEKVPDESIFRAQFIAALEGEGDTDKDGYITGVELGEFLQKTVTNYTKGNQHPQYGKIRDRNLDKGDFVFPVEVASIDTTVNMQPSKEGAPVPKAPAPITLRGHLQINVNVASVKVMLNDEFVGIAKVGKPLNMLNIPTGNAKLRLEAEDYPALEREVVITQNRWVQEAFEFQHGAQAPVRQSSTISNERPAGDRAHDTVGDGDLCYDAAEGQLVAC